MMASLSLLALNEAPVEWQKLVDEKEALFESVPPANFSQQEFQAFLTELGRRAEVLSGRYDAFFREDPTGAQADEAWESWLELLSASASIDRSRFAGLEAIKEEFLSDPAFSLERRGTIHRNRIERAGSLKEREHLIREAHRELREKGERIDYERLMLETAEASDPQNARRILDELMPALRGYYHEKALELQRKLERIGRELSLKLTALDGEEIALEDYRGKVVLLNFWPTWCPPCIAGLPKLKDVYENHREAGFEVLGLSYDTDREALTRFLSRTILPWPQFFDEQGLKSPLALELG